ncbi:MAG: hypothetical protein ABIR52_05365 [Casimicrobiaceae bacterium]
MATINGRWDRGERCREGANAVDIATIHSQESTMKVFSAALMCTAMALAAGNAAAADTMKPKDGMMKDGMKHDMTMQECKDHMAMAAKPGMTKDDAMMKKDTMCTEMMNKDGMMKKDDGMMKKDMPKK